LQRDDGRVEAIGEAWGQDVYRVGLDTGCAWSGVREGDLIGRNQIGGKAWCVVAECALRSVIDVEE
jgi:hypothetical protein